MPTSEFFETALQHDRTGITTGTYFKPVLRIRILRSMFLGLLDPIHKYEVRIRILLWSRKKKKKTLIPTVQWLLYDFLPLKNEKDVNFASKGNKQKKILVVAILNFTDENSRIRIR